MTGMSKDQINWRRVNPPALLLENAPGMRAYSKDAGDGLLTVFAGREPGVGFHLSISHRTYGPDSRPGRYPSWDEICEARDRFTPADVTMAMMLPPRVEWINVHETTFHLYELP